MSDREQSVVYDDWRRAVRIVAVLWVLGTVALTLFLLGITSEDATIGSIVTTAATAGFVLGVPALLFVGLAGLVDLRRNRSHRG